MECDVLIVGAGRTGLMLANQLARHGVRIRIVDRGIPAKSFYLVRPDGYIGL